MLPHAAFCFIKLPLSWPMSFPILFSPPRPAEGGSDRAAWGAPGFQLRSTHHALQDCILNYIKINSFRYCVFYRFYSIVLGMAGIGLIFTRSQEGTQPGWLTQTGQTKWGIWYRVMSCSVPSGAAGQGRGQLWLGTVLGIRWWESCSVHSIAFLLISIVVLSVRFLCCSVKLSLSWPTSFAFFFQFSSPPQRGHGR